MSTQILITGGTGFAGSHLVAALKDAGYTDIAVTSYSGEAPDMPEFADVSVHKLDMTDAAAVGELLKEVQPAQIYHLAAIAAVGKSFEQGAQLLHNNTQLQINLLEAVRLHSPEARVLVIGSAEEYGMSVSEDEVPITESHELRPVNPYGVSKVTQDLLAFAYAQSHNLQIVRVRPFNHIGARQTPEFAVPSFAQQIVAIERGQQHELRVGNLSGIRDFTDVSDMMRAYILLMERGVVGEVYNVGSGTGVSMQSIVDQLTALATVAVPVVVDQSRMRPLDIPKIIANNEKITALGWKPEVPLQESLQQVVEYWRTQS